MIIFANEEGMHLLSKKVFNFPCGRVSTFKREKSASRIPPWRFRLFALVKKRVSLQFTKRGSDPRVEKFYALFTGAYDFLCVLLWHMVLEIEIQNRALVVWCLWNREQKQYSNKCGTDKDR